MDFPLEIASPSEPPARRPDQADLRARTVSFPTAHNDRVGGSSPPACVSKGAELAGFLYDRLVPEIAYPWFEGHIGVFFVRRAAHRVSRSAFYFQRYFTSKTATTMSSCLRSVMPTPLRFGEGSDSRFSWRPLPVLARVERFPSSRSGKTSRSNACRRQHAASDAIGGVEVCDRL